MKIRVYSRYGEVGFVVTAENDTDHAILGLITSSEYTEGKTFRHGGSTYSDGVVTDFNFGWTKNDKG